MAENYRRPLFVNYLLIDYVDFQFSLSGRQCEVRSNPGCPALDCFVPRNDGGNGLLRASQ
ncbi:MAG: hypothetical protein LBS88_03380 [Tannerellaceae bacterium]|nr:hypothetical protein [Tannerellaceae bacterium]